MNKGSAVSKKSSEIHEKKEHPIDSLTPPGKEELTPQSLDQHLDNKEPYSTKESRFHTQKHGLSRFKNYRLHGCLGVLAVIVGINTYHISYLKEQLYLFKTSPNQSSSKQDTVDTILSLLHRIQKLEQHTEKLSTHNQLSPQPSLLSLAENEKIFQTFPLGPQQIEQIETTMRNHGYGQNPLELEKIHVSFLKIKAFLYAHDLRFILSTPSLTSKTQSAAFEKLDQSLSSLIALDHEKTLQTSLDLIRVKFQDIGEFQNLYIFPGYPPPSPHLSAHDASIASNHSPDIRSLDTSTPFSLESLYNGGHHLWQQFCTWVMDESSWIKKYFSLQKNAPDVMPPTIKNAVIKALEQHDLELAHHHVTTYLSQINARDEKNTASHQQWDMWTKHILARIHVEKALVALQQSLIEGIAS